MIIYILIYLYINIFICICLYIKDIYCKELVHALWSLADSKIYRVRSARVNDIVPVWRRMGSRPHKSWCFNLSLKARKILMSRFKSFWAEVLSLPLETVSLFVAFKPSVDWKRCTLVVEGYLLYSLPSEMWISGKITLTDSPWVTFDQISGHLVAPPHWHTQLTTIVTLSGSQAASQEDNQGAMERDECEEGLMPPAIIHVSALFSNWILLLQSSSDDCSPGQPLDCTLMANRKPEPLT